MKLEFLILDYNNLSGLIPFEIGKLSNLRTLALSNNSLTRFVPLGLFELKKLKILDIGNNQLSWNDSAVIFYPLVLEILWHCRRNTPLALRAEGTSVPGLDTQQALWKYSSLAS
ncbi:hypothetical protein HPP92_013557 [Vanilla planifolia]|uniref:Uncharacterized protein n=1 Tax=Vanilla planifolia TaxID=51239 RepID=A0A835UYY2_VANPL|nr:hypothetical protein HPP92_013557 [Vanilla planifolia]